MHAQTRIVLLSAALALGACSVYRPDVRQGNYVDPTKFAQVKPGMTREQVRFLLGPPMIADGFHHAQWDYFFWLETQFIKAGQVKRHFVVHFDGDVVSAIEDPDKMAAPPAASTGNAPIAKPSTVTFEKPVAAPVADPAGTPVEAPPVEAPPSAPSPVEPPPAQS